MARHPAARQYFNATVPAGWHQHGELVDFKLLDRVAVIITQALPERTLLPGLSDGWAIRMRAFCRCRGAGAGAGKWSLGIARAGDNGDRHFHQCAVAGL